MGNMALFLFLANLVWSQGSGPARCVRPLDMSQARLVKSYIACLDKRAALCKQTQNKKLPACKPVSTMADFRKRFPENVADINPKERCQILKTGAYSCLQDPIRFIVKEEAKPAPPQPNSGIKPGPRAGPSPSAEKDLAPESRSESTSVPGPMPPLPPPGGDSGSGAPENPAAPPPSLQN